MLNLINSQNGGNEMTDIKTFVLVLTLGNKPGVTPGTGPKPSGSGAFPDQGSFTKTYQSSDSYKNDDGYSTGDSYSDSAGYRDGKTSAGQYR